jgi:hypothetical protein
VSRLAAYTCLIDQAYIECHKFKVYALCAVITNIVAISFSEEIFG